MMKYTEETIKNVAQNISNFMYKDNLQATKELMELFDRISRNPLNTPEDYVKMYDDNFYTYITWDKLVKSEEEQNDGLTEDELREELKDNVHGSVWQLPCGWYVQCV